MALDFGKMTWSCSKEEKISIMGLFISISTTKFLNFSNSQNALCINVNTFI